MTPTARLSDRLQRSDFQQVDESHYRLAYVPLGLQYDVDRLRRDRHELVGELAVTCDLPGAKTVDGMLSVGTFNLSSPAARAGRARDLAARSAAPEIDFGHHLEELCQRVLASERGGQPAILLRNVPRPTADLTIAIDGFPILRDHPSIMFADGGTGKSTLALYFAGELERRGVSVLYLDWELDAATNRLQLERLFGEDMPDVKYRRCDRPLVIEVDGIAQQVRECAIDYVICDSISFATDGPPEAAETAQRFFRALRQLRVGSLNLAHINKGEHGDRKPFGSSFWFNGCRACWYAERAETSNADGELNLALLNRKNNLGRLQSGIGFDIQFDGDRTRIVPGDVTANAQLAAKLPLLQRMKQALRRGPKTLAALAEELDGNVDTIDRYVRRHSLVFSRVSGSADGICRIALLERRIA
jgi:hypothetical protein